MRRATALLVLALPFASPTPAARAAPPDPAPVRGPRIEVAFALDATGSMGGYIAQARAKIRDIAEDLAAGEPRPDVRFGLVAYRDKGDAFVTRVHPFTTDIGEIKKALDGTEAQGGGDTPEAVLEGLRDALTKLAWTPPEDDGVLRLLYLVGDASPQHYPDGPTEAWIGAEARRRHVVLHSIMCGGAGDLEASFEPMARRTEGRAFRLGDHARATATAEGRRPSLAAAMTDSARAYSGSIGVSFGDPAAKAVRTQPLAVPAVKTTGLDGAHARWVKDAATFGDLWSVHTSLTPAAERPPAPAIDFATHHVLVLGGRDVGLTLERVELAGERRAARVRPADERGVRFVLVEVQ